ncbi:MAG TPA: ribosome biogenesis GTP-binding protein YihA/YsxC [Gemmatimonadaceae bacterium]|nr:ribosome biogenesis GTP-binding protein YihA/YsxC [Gemmatimonadaceae bacterium]
MAAARDTADPLVIRRLEFAGGMASPDGWRPAPGLPEIAFSGRSNVGKSSLLNALVRRRGLARVSRTPGRTREINFFVVNDAFVLADLPGYGFARVSKEQRAVWRPLIESFLRTSPELRGIVQLLDIRQAPTPDDLEMLEFLAELGIPTIAAVTKVDKLSPRPRETRLHEIAVATGLEEAQMIPFSAVTGLGRDELAAAVAELLRMPSWRGQ